MHYANGREAKAGDSVIYKSGNTVLAGVIHSLSESSTTCNGRVSYPIPGGFNQDYVTISGCYHAEDALAAITPKITVISSAPTPEPAPAPYVVQEFPAALPAGGGIDVANQTNPPAVQ